MSARRVILALRAFLALTRLFLVRTVQAQIPWGTFRTGSVTVTNTGFVEVNTIQQDLFVRISQNGNWPAGDVWRGLASWIRVERLAFDS